MKHAKIGAAYRSAKVTPPPIRNAWSSINLFSSGKQTVARGSAAAIFVHLLTGRRELQRLVQHMSQTSV